MIEKLVGCQVWDTVQRVCNFLHRFRLIPTDKNTHLFVSNHCIYRYCLLEIDNSLDILFGSRIFYLLDSLLLKFIDLRLVLVNTRVQKRGCGGFYCIQPNHANRVAIQFSVYLCQTRSMHRLFARTCCSRRLIVSFVDLLVDTFGSGKSRKCLEWLVCRFETSISPRVSRVFLNDRTSQSMRIYLCLYIFRSTEEVVPNLVVRLYIF